jgi:predicted O-methyltransferase YrrM
MSPKTIAVTESISKYLLDVTVAEPEVLRQLRNETMDLAGANMQIAPEQGQFMRLLVSLLGASRCIEIGTYTGYSSISVGLALPPTGLLIACDVNPETSDIAKQYWQLAGLTEIMQLELRPAKETLDSLVASNQAGTFDFAFIDADKEAYDTYYEQCLILIRVGGLIAIDNALWDGRVADPLANDASTRAIKALNRKVTADSRVTSSLVPIGDGLLLARKK